MRLPVFLKHLALDSTLLRQVGRRLRMRHPLLYARLNRIRKRAIVGDLPADAYQVVALERFSSLVTLRGARVLELGSDLELRVLQLLLKAGAREAWGVNNFAEFWSGRDAPWIDGAGGARLYNQSAEAMDFEACSFDLVFSVATFEHILDLPRALAEAHRVLKPGGMLYSNFAPIWSGGKGHHVNAKVGEEEVRHSMPEKNPLPDHAHLLLGPDEMRASLAGRVSPALIEPIIDYVYRGQNINRLFFHQYEQMFARSPFKVRSIRPFVDRVDPQLARILRFRYPDEERFDATGMEVLLVKE